jgi:peptide/nickel transport system permease protein
MVNFIIRRLSSILATTLLVCLVSYVLFSVAPGGPMQKLAEISQSGKNRLDPQAVQREMQRFELDLYQIPRFMRWLVGVPTGAFNLLGQQWDPQVGCGEQVPAGKKVVLRYADGHTEESDCLKPVYASDLETRRHGQGVLRFDFGNSQELLRDRPVTELIASRFWPTILLIGLANLFALIIAIPLGILAAVKQYSKFDYFLTTFTLFTSAMPTLFLGIMGILFFAVILKDWGWFHLPAQGMVSNRDEIVPLLGAITAESSADVIWHLVLPVSILTLVSLAGWSRFIRGSMLEVLKADYVRTARAKGLGERLVIMRHALRNALIPFITLVVGIIPGLVGGAVVTETIFSWPGLGRVFVASLFASDYAVSMASVLISTLLILFSFMVADILYSLADPRIRLS